MTLLFPPFRTSQVGHTALYRTRQCDGAVADLSKGPTRFDSHIHVHAARTAGLGPSPKADLIEKALNFESNPAYIGPTDAWNRVEIDAQFVRMIEIIRAHRMRV
jgi:hypothetical protein